MVSGWEDNFANSSFFKKIVFNWRIIDLQCCAAFCQTSTWISHRHTYVPFLLNLPPTPIPTPPLQDVTGHQRVIQRLPTGYPWYTRECTCISATLSGLPTSPSPSVSISVFSMSVSPLLPCKQVHQYHFSRFRIFILIHICFSLSDLLHSV